LSSVLRYTLVTSDHLCAQVVVDDAHAAPPLIGGAVLRPARAAALFLDGVAKGVPQVCHAGSEAIALKSTAGRPRTFFTP
jgi:hypothetical protein